MCPHYRQTLFIDKRGLKESIAIPVIGSGPIRLTQTREEIIREIIKSFIASSAFLFVPKGFNTQEPAFRRGSLWGG
jgi:hypothetical protein